MAVKSLDDLQAEHGIETYVSTVVSEKKPSEIYCSVAERAKRTKIDGKTAEEWKVFFELVLPPDASVSQTVELCSRATYLLGEVYHSLSEAELREAALASANNRAYNKAYAVQSQSTKKKLANATLQTLAESDTTNARMALDSARSEVQFWKRRVEALKSQCNILDKVTYLISLEARTIKFNE